MIRKITLIPGWRETGGPGEKIAHDFQAAPLQIMTDAALGSGARIHMGLRLNAETNNITGTGGVKIKLSDPPKYFITFCSTDWTEFQTKCTQRIKTWTITKTSSSVSIECNQWIVAAYQYSSSNRDSCRLHWGDKSGAFRLKSSSGNSSGDTASKMYRVKPLAKSGG